MGIYVCPKHGRQGFYQTCEHIYSKLEKGEKPEMFPIPLHNSKICKKCYDGAELEKYKNLTGPNLIDLPMDQFQKVDQLLAKAYNATIKYIVCLKCEKEFKK